MSDRPVSRKPDPTGDTLEHRFSARHALLDAFAELALSRRYHEFGVGQIANAANVARSTFYYHFKSKDELLIENLSPMFLELGRAVWAEQLPPEVEHWTTHIWEQRTRAGRMFRGATGRRLTEALATQMRGALQDSGCDPTLHRLAPLIADQVASGMLGLLESWTAGRSAASPSEIARLLWSSARAIAKASAASAS